MEQEQLFTYVRAVGALACIITLNALVLLAFVQGNDVSVPKWSIYMLVVLIGGLLGLDALLEVTPVQVNRDQGRDE